MVSTLRTSDDLYLSLLKWMQFYIFSIRTERWLVDTGLRFSRNRKMTYTFVVQYYSGRHFQIFFFFFLFLEQLTEQRKFKAGRLHNSSNWDYHGTEAT